MPIDALTILNRACARIGVEPLEDMSEESFGGQAAQLVYDGVVEFLIGIYPFSFARELRPLTKLAAASDYGFTAAFQLPAERVGPPLRVTDTATDPDCQFTRYILAGETLHADAAAIFAEIKFLPPPAKWSGAFREAAVLALGAELAIPQAADQKLRDSLRVDAYGTPTEMFRGGAMGVAIREDARGTPARRMPARDPFTASWVS